MDPAMEAPGSDPNEKNKIKHEGLQFVFSQNRDAFITNPCPYADDGNPDMYTQENIEKRNNLRTSPIVKKSIDDFITDNFTLQSNNCSKEEYFKMFMKIGTILRPGIEADDLNRIIKEDFETDSQDKAPDFSAIKDETRRQAQEKEWEAQP